SSERLGSPRVCAFLFFEKNGEGTLSLDDSGGTLLSSQRADLVETHRIDSIPLVDRSREHRARASGLNREGGEEQGIQPGRILLRDRDVGSVDLQLDRGLGSGSVGHRVGQVKSRSGL